MAVNFCPNCGQPAAGRFCGSCGGSLEFPSAGSQGSPTQPSAPPPRPPAPPPHRKGKGTVLLFVLLPLGALLLLVVLAGGAYLLLGQGSPGAEESDHQALVDSTPVPATPTPEPTPEPTPPPTPAPTPPPPPQYPSVAGTFQLTNMGGDSPGYCPSVPPTLTIRQDGRNLTFDFGDFVEHATMTADGGGFSKPPPNALEGDFVDNHNTVRLHYEGPGCTLVAWGHRTR